MKKNEKSFTLIELMIGTVIIGISLFSLLSGLVATYKLSESTRNTIIAAEDGRRVVEQMRSFCGDSLNLIVNEDWSLWAAANGCSNLSQEQILVAFIDRDSSGDPFDDNPLEVIVNVTWQEFGRWRILNFHNLFTHR